jgi:hypothetical protein
MPPRYNATIGHPGISFLLFLLTKHPAIEESDNHRHDLGEILISLGRDRTLAHVHDAEIEIGEGSAPSRKDIHWGTRKLAGDR